jgi:hypothetical protein
MEASIRLLCNYLYTVTVLCLYVWQKLNTTIVQINKNYSAVKNAAHILACLSVFLLFDVYNEKHGEKNAHNCGMKMVLSRVRQ